jgi:RNA polymerase sigma-70 factor (ECF subfamily)
MLIFYLAMIETADDKSLFEIIYDEYKNQMYSIACSILKDEHLAEDAVQEALIGIAKQIEIFREMPEDKMKAYICITAKNAAINIYNKEVKYQSKIISIEDLPPLFIEDNALALQISNERQRTLVNIIASFPSLQRSILTLRYTHNMKCSNIAIALGRKPSSVRKELSRARKILAEKCRKVGLDIES